MVIKQVKELFNFSFIAILNAIIGLSGLYILLEVFEWNIYLSYIVIYFFGITFSYFLNSRFTFKKKTNVSDAQKFYVIYIAGLIFGLLSLKIIDVLFLFTPFIKVLLVIPLRSLLTYIFLQKFIYQSK